MYKNPNDRSFPRRPYEGNKPKDGMRSTSTPGAFSPRRRVYNAHTIRPVQASVDGLAQFKATEASGTPAPKVSFHAHPAPAHGHQTHRPAHSRPSGHSSMGKHPSGRPLPRMKQHSAPIKGKKTDDVIPPLADDSIRVITLGGVEGIGKNMLMVEFRNDIFIVDAGFMFKDDSTPGIDYILPNIKYLEDRKDKIRALFITHGHLDHIGAIPYIMEKLGNPPIYTRNLTSIMIKKRQEEFPHLPPLNFKLVEKDDQIKIGDLPIRFYSVTHTMPETMGIIIKTPYGAIATAGDPKLDHIDGVPTAEEEREYGKLAEEKIVLFLNDSTNVENPGWSTPEKLVHKNLEDIITNIKGRIIIGTFASTMERSIKIIEVAEKLGKKVIIEGRSMKTNVEVAKLVNMLKIKDDTIIPSEDIDRYPQDRIVIIATGAQGEEFAALMRMASKNHKNIKLHKGDTVVLSSSVIPGNEKSVQRLKDNLARQGCKIMSYRTSEVYIHSSGHANRKELEWMFRRVNPRFFVPIHGNHYMLRLHADLAYEIGMPESSVIVPDNGTIMEIQNGGEKFVRLPVMAPNNIVMVDGFSVGDIQEVVIRDRQMLAQDGMFVIIASVDTKTGKLKKSPDIISRGFIYLRESQDLLRDARNLIKRVVEVNTVGMNPINFDYLKDTLTDEVSKYLFQQTAKRPMVIPVLIGV